jgi:uncharacterized protein (TIGR02145 family)
MKLLNWILILSLSVLTLVACKKDKGPALAELSTKEATSISASTASSGGNITNDGGAAITDRGVCYSTFPNPTTSNNNITEGTGTGDFEVTLQGLLPLTKYYARAFAINVKGTAYGNQIEFTTPSGANLPTVTTNTITSISGTSAIGGGNVTNTGGSAVNSRGIVYSTNPAPNLNDNRVNSGTGTGTYTSNLSGLSPSTTYYVRAFATNSTGTAYGQEVTFSTSSSGMLASLTTTNVTNITNNSATSGGNITNTGGSAVTERGIVFATTANPTTANTKVTSGTGQGTFTANMTGLTQATTYYVRAYAINSSGTAYGNQQLFTTGGAGSLATVTTAAINNITINSARSGGEVTADGGSGVSERGVVYANTQNPTIANSKVVTGTGLGSFTSNISGLNAGSTYYVRAFATNTSGTAYGQQLSFTTTGGGGSAPTLTTSATSLITSNSARSGGTVSADGGAAVTERGIVYATTPNPTINSTKLNSGTTGIGSYIVNISGLSANTTYYVRAYAINSNGTGYGNEISFMTSGASVPTLTTTVASNITTNSASSGGNVTSDGGSPVTARGIAYSTSANPTIANSVVNSGSGTGSFTSNMSGLQPATLYYVRAFATNSGGTGYGNQITFTTSTNPGQGCQGLTMLSYNGHTYNLVEIGSQCWFAENLRTKNYRNGSSIPYVTGSSQWNADRTGAYTQYDNDPSREALFGLLYNWYAVENASGLCPTGWKVPTDQDFCTLEAFLGMSDPCLVDGWRGTNQGAQLKDNVNWNGSNTSGFSGLGAGNRNPPGSFGNLNSNGYFWSSTSDGVEAWYRTLGGNRNTVQRIKFAKEAGFSVRCVKQ